MSRPRRARAGGTAAGCLAVAVVVPVLYYGIQALLRTPAREPLQVIAHRGGAAYAPENTLAAFRNAIRKGVRWLEFDVQMTKDGALVVMHDATVDRTTNGSGAVRDLTLEQIRALDAGNGEKVPRFEEVLEVAKASGVNILPETKQAHLYPGMEEKLLQAIEQAGYIDKTVIQSFEGESLERLHRLNPQVRLCALYGLWKFDISEPPGEAQYVCPMADMVLLDPSMVRQAHEQGRQVFVYFGVVENPLGTSAMRFFGVDGMIVDDPLALEQP